jgi:RHS repeat-associated protein
LYDTANGRRAAEYEYGPFGELLRATGPVANTSPFRWSSKYLDGETGAAYYGYRYFDPTSGRWLSRDPVSEAGGSILYGIVGNHPISKWDYMGLYFGVAIPGAPLPPDYRLPEDRPQFPPKYEWKPPVPNPRFPNLPLKHVEIKKCNVVIFMGHGHAVPDLITVEGIDDPTKMSEACGGGVGYGCDGYGLKIHPFGPPGCPAPRNKQACSMLDAASDAEAAFAAGVSQAVAICKNPKKCCKSVTVKIECMGVSFWKDGLTFPWELCGRTKVISCKP